MSRMKAVQKANAHIRRVRIIVEEERFNNNISKTESIMKKKVTAKKPRTIKLSPKAIELKENIANAKKNTKVLMDYSKLKNREVVNGTKQNATKTEAGVIIVTPPKPKKVTKPKPIEKPKEVSEPQEEENMQETKPDEAKPRDLSNAGALKSLIDSGDVIWEYKDGEQAIEFAIDVAKQKVSWKEKAEQKRAYWCAVTNINKYFKLTNV